MSDDTTFRFRILRFHIIQQNIPIPCRNTEIGVFRVSMQIWWFGIPLNGSEYPDYRDKHHYYYYYHY